MENSDHTLKNQDGKMQCEIGMVDILLDPQVAQKIIARQLSLPQIVCQASILGIPTPAFMGTLSYLDAYRSVWLPACQSHSSAAGLFRRAQI
jgi:6-phosphogluconate dehydrogenase